MNLSKRHKLFSIKDKYEIKFILENGKRINTKFGPVFLLFEKTKDDRKSCILLKKNIGKAFYRNYIKRILRVYIVNKITLFNSYNRVIFLYRDRSRIKKSKVIFAEYDRHLNFLSNSR